MKNRLKALIVSTLMAVTLVAVTAPTARAQQDPREQMCTERLNREIQDADEWYQVCSMSSGWLRDIFEYLTGEDHCYEEKIQRKTDAANRYYECLGAR